MITTIVLSDGHPCEVRRLGLYELLDKGRPIVGPYRYSLLMATGQIVEDEYDIRALTYEPTAPDVAPDKIKDGSQAAYQLKEYETYLAAVSHEKTRVESYFGYIDDITAYILTNCLASDDTRHIVTIEDWDAVYKAALVPELTIEEVANTLEKVFRGHIQWQAGAGGAFWHLWRKWQNSGAAAMGT
jgi:hypothetical protein